MATPLTVLILEDWPDDATLMLDELRQAGFDPVWQRVETETDYVAHLHTGVDVILADYTLPHFDALRALQLLQERGWDIPFFIVSGTIGEDCAVSAMKQGATDYLLKDRLARLGPGVLQALQQKQLRTAKQQTEVGLARLALLHQITRAIGERQDLHSIFLVVLHHLEHDLPLAFACFCLGTPGSDELTVTAMGSASQALATIVGLEEQAVVSLEQMGLRACMDRQTVSVPDTAQALTPLLRRFAQAGLRSLIATPCIVEDSVFGLLLVARHVRQSLQDVLQTEGHLGIVADGGVAGLAALRADQARQEPFSVVITDLGMPGMDGREVARAVKQTFPETPVILLAGWGQTLRREGPLPPHVDHVLSKPPRLRDVWAALKTVTASQGGRIGHGHN